MLLERQVRRPRSFSQALFLTTLVSLGVGSGTRVAVAESWTQLSPSGTAPSARWNQSAIYNSTDNSMIIFGGTSGSTPYKNETWQLTLGASPVWAQLAPSGFPPNRKFHAAIYNSTDNSMIMFGGDDGSSFKNDVWKLSLGASPGWTQLSPSGSIPSARYSPTAIYNSADNSMIVFGGDTGGSMLNDVWKLSLGGSPSWTQLSPSGTIPVARRWHSAIYNSSDNSMIVFGGVDGSTQRSDVWKLSLGGSPAWTQLTGGTPRVSSQHSAVFFSADNSMVVYGGGDGGLVYEDVWKTPVASTVAWSQINITGPTPGQRNGHSAVMNTLDGSMVIFGGADSNTWKLPISASSFFVAGTLSDNTGAAMNAVSVSLHGVTPSSTTTNSSGMFSFAAAPVGNYTLTTSKTGYVWTPGSRVFSLSADRAGQNFVGSLASVFQATSYSFATKWGSQGSGDGQFSVPRGLAVDSMGNVYVADSTNASIQKFSSTGVFTLKWGTSGTGDGQLSGPWGLAVDGDNNIYVADTSNHRIQKFSSTGTFLAKFGISGSGDGQFNYPTGVAVDTAGNIYIADQSNHRIQKLDGNGNFIAKWGSFGSGTSQFNLPRGVTVDSNGNVFVSDTWGQRIQKFTAGGTYVAQWGSEGSGVGQFSYPHNAATDPNGNVYVLEDVNHRFQKFTGAGTHMVTVGGYGSADGQLNRPNEGIAIDVNGNVYVADTSNYRIQKFAPSVPLTTFLVSGTLTNNIGTAMNAVSVSLHGVTPFSTTTNSSGLFTFATAPVGNYTLTASKTDYVWTPGSRVFSLAATRAGQNFVGSLASIFQSTLYSFDRKWGTIGSGDGQMAEPTNIVIDLNGNVYETDYGNHRVQKFTSAGTFLEKWGSGSYGTGDGQFNNPYAMAVDPNGMAYVADRANNRIQKFSTNGTFLAKWGSSGSGDGQLNYPSGVAVDAIGNVYVSDTENSRIQKFTSTGTFLAKWGSNGSGDGQFQYPMGLDCDSSGNLYVSDVVNRRIQKFTGTGTFLAKWGSSGSGDGQFISAFDLALDASGNVYVVEYGNQRIQKFNSNGTFLAKIGTAGSGDGQFSLPQGVDVDTSGNIYVADYSNSRVQKFSPVVVASTYSVSGTVTDTLGAALSGVSLSLKSFAFSATSASDGTYSILSVPTGTYTLVSSKANYSFNPLSRTLTLSANQAGINFTGTLTLQAGGGSGPTAPAAFTGAALSTTSISWSWTDNATNELTYYVHDDGQISLVTLTANARGWIETGLSSNAAYTRHANAMNSSGNSDSGSKTVYTLANVPTGLTLSGRTTTSITLVWSGNGTRYAVERASDLNGSPGSYSTIKVWADAITTSLYADTGLTPATTYWYRIKAYNGDQTLTDPATAITATTGPNAPGAAVTSVTFTNQTSLTYSWTAPQGTIVGYDFQVGTTLGASDVFDSSLGLTLLNVVTNLQNGKTYFARVRSRDSGGAVSDWVAGSAGAGVDLTPPIAPTLASATHPESTVSYVDSSVGMTLKGPSDFSGTAGFYYLLDQTLTTVPTAVTGTWSTASVITLSLASEGTYYFHAVAKDGAGNVGTSAAHYTLRYSTTVSSTTDNTLKMGDGTHIEIPSGAVEGDKKIVVKKPKEAELPKVPMDAGLKGSSAARDIKLTDGTSKFKKDVTISIVYQDGEVTGLDQAKLKLAYFDETKSQWKVLVKSQVDASAKKVTVKVDHLTLFRIVEYSPPTEAVSTVSNYPNPFAALKETTRIRYTLKDDAEVEILIYDFFGGLVWQKKIAASSEGAAAGVNEVEWNGVNGVGARVGMGAYICLVKAGGRVEKTKIGVK